MRSGFRAKAPIVLFVEDCEEICELHAAALERVGLIVHPAPTLAQAALTLALVQPDLIVMDRHLPDGDGFAFAVELRESEATRDIAVVAFSAATTRESFELAQAAGVAAYVRKPCSPQALTEAVLRVLGDREPVPLSLT